MFNENVKWMMNIMMMIQLILENLLLDDKDVLKISDFGLSALCVGAGDTKKMLMTTCGTPNYVARKFFYFCVISFLIIFNLSDSHMNFN